MQTEKFTDQSVMPFGQYKGQTLANVPNDYLLYLYENDRAGRLKTYIHDNMKAIYQGAMKERRERFKGNKRGRQY